MKFILLFATVGVVSLAFTACAPTSPTGRIDRNPEIYNSLPAKQQEEVRDGRISRGMTHEAVLLAWGRPSRQAEVVGQDGPTARWDYVGTQPVFNTHFYGDYGYGRYDPCDRYSRSAFAMGPQVTYVPYHRASVWFVDGKVDGWESIR